MFEVTAEYMRKIFSGVGRLSLFVEDGNLADSLDKKNRWYQLADRLPWGEMELIYLSKLDPNRKGATNLPARMALGALIIQSIEGLSDRGTIAAIQENPYMQYFVGLTHFTSTPIFDASLFVTLRKRMGAEDINKISLLLHEKEAEKLTELEGEKTAEKETKNNDNEPEGEGNSQTNNEASSSSEEKKAPEGTQPTLKGAVVVDATCCPVEIPYPTDIRLIYESIQMMCKIRKSYGEVTKKEIHNIDNIAKEAKALSHSFILRKRKPRGGLKRIIRQLLNLLDKANRGFLKQFGQNSTACLDALPAKKQQYISTILKVYAQQYGKAYRGENIEERIVNIHQPHIRPIVRGKAGRNTEFGPKVNVSIVDGYSFIDHLCYNAFNEGTKLEDQIRLYQERFGQLPERVYADRIYMNKANCEYMSKNNIIPVGQRLGRPPKEKMTAAQLKDMHQRNIVEGTFGTVKQKYGAEKLRTRLPNTTESGIAMSFLAKNIMKFLRELLCQIFSTPFSAQKRQFFVSSTPSPQNTPLLTLIA